MDFKPEDRFLGSQEEKKYDLKSRILEESKEIWRVAFPAILASVTSFGILVVTQSFIGHISDLNLAAYGLVMSIIARFIYGILLGMSSAMGTLCGQAFGAGKFHMMGIYLQRSWIVSGIAAAALVPVCIFAAQIFKILGQNADISRVGGNISLWFIPVLCTYIFTCTAQMYLQAQLKNMIIAWLSVSSFMLHLLLSWIFVNKLSMGVPGAMGAMIISLWLFVLGKLVYIFGGGCPRTWQGFTQAAFFDIWPMIKLSVSSSAMIWLDYWYNGILVLLAGNIKNAEIATSAFSICLNINELEQMVCTGFLCAACVRVSNGLGRGNANATRFSIKVILCKSLCTGIVFFIICLVFGNKIGYLFTKDVEVVDAVSNLSILLASSMFMNSIPAALEGVFVGAGLQITVGIINLFCYYIIGIPVGVLLGFVADLQIKGIWIGRMCGVLAQTLALVFMACRTDWDDQVNKASTRLNRWLVEPLEESVRNPNRT